MRKREDRAIFLAAVVMFFIIDVAVWWQVFSENEGIRPGIVALDVGQGDATLLVLEGGPRILVDAGSGRSAADALDRFFGASGGYIDLAVVTHPQLDHFGGFTEVLERYEVGAFVMSGRMPAREDSAPPGEWDELLATIEARRIPIVTLGEGDRIGHSGTKIYVLSPGGALLQSADLNDTSLVLLADISGFRALLTGDIGMSVERYLAGKFDISAEVLKVPHHGSKYSSSAEFLDLVRPSVALIEVGRNRYGHPTPEAIKRIQTAGAAVFRTDTYGNIEVYMEKGKLGVRTEKRPGRLP